MTLISLPDAKMFHPFLTIGHEYQIIKPIGNGYIIEVDKDTTIIILAERFK